MKKIFISIICCLLALISSHAQNLIQNGSFENTTPCPTTWGQMNFAAPWVSAKGTCDLFNSCSPVNSGYSVPNNSLGNQSARTGNGYGGFFATQGYFETREYLHAKFSSPLIAGKQYCVAFYVVLADDVDNFGEFISDVAVNDLGAYIGSAAIPPNPFNFAHIPVTPQIINNSATQILSDRNNWMKISGSFTAIGGEQYITIGSFSSQANQDTTWLDIWNSNNWAYYLIDDISLVDCSGGALNTTLTGITQICEGTSTTITATTTGGFKPYTYLWSNNLPNAPVQVVSPVVTTTYSVIVMDSVGNSSSQQISVNVASAPIANAGPDIFHCPAYNVILTSSGGGAYLWNTGNTTASINVAPSVATPYWVIITNSAGCTDVDTVNTFINDTCSVELDVNIFIPNVFSPNDDGTNDLFTIKTEGIKSLTCKIYNRWGILMHEMVEVSQSFWDGKTKSGRNGSDGTYYYVFEGFDFKDEKYIKKGYMQIVR